MISAGEAYTIAIKVNEIDDQLKNIEEDIVRQASKGKIYTYLYPSVPYHPGTISALEENGYKVIKNYDRMTKTFSYEIYWG